MLLNAGWHDRSAETRHDRLVRPEALEALRRLIAGRCMMQKKT